MPSDRRTYSERATVRCICRICGVAFDAKRADARYHSAACRKAASRMRPEVEELTAQVNRAHAAAERTLFDSIDQVPTRTEIESTLCALDVLWPSLQPWIRTMLFRLASKQKVGGMPI